MSLPDRDNGYNFDAFLDWREAVDYYRDDAFIQRALKTFSAEHWLNLDRVAREVSVKASTRWRDFADNAAREENRPAILHYDAHNRRIDRIQRSRDSEIMEREVFAEALFADQGNAWEKLIKLFLIYQNGEACISCPIACTDGLAALLDQYANTAELEYIRNHIKQGIDGEFAIAAQYISEIQGGSDIPSNLLEAVETSDGWRLYGKKFFCSASHADYAVVSAKPVGSQQVAAFIVPSWLPGDSAREQRNGHSIDRLKPKSGTCELPTAEITYHGALAYPIGPLDRGLANIVGVVLTSSRITVGIFSAAVITRAVREASHYATFRNAFGRPIAEFPMLAAQLRRLQTVAQRSCAGMVKFYAQMIALENALATKPDTAAAKRLRQQGFEVRELIMLQKITCASDSVEALRLAISVFGGHGVVEDFSALPRLFRDAMVNELWEGPKNVLLGQIHRDLQQAASWYPPAEFVASLLAGADAKQINMMAKELEALLAHPDLNQFDEETIAICGRWEIFCSSLFHAYQNRALAEVLTSAAE